MVDTVRVTQQYAEVLSTGGVGDDTVRATQQYAEVLSTGGVGDDTVRATQQYVEVLRSSVEASPKASLDTGSQPRTIVIHGRN